MIYISVVVALSTFLQTEDVPLEQARSKLVAMRIERIGRDAVVASYEQAIKQYQTDPNVAELMIDLVALYSQVSIPDKGIHPDYKLALYWARRAAEAAPPFTDLYRRANGALVSQLKERSPEEALEVLNRIRANTERTPTNRATAYHREIEIASSHGDIAAGEKACHELLMLDRGENALPMDTVEQRDLAFKVYELQRSATGIFLWSVISAPWSQERKIEYINQFIADHPFGVVKLHAEAAVKELAEREAQRFAAPTGRMDVAVVASPSRVRFIIINVAVITLLVLLIGLRKYDVFPFGKT